MIKKLIKKKTNSKDVMQVEEDGINIARVISKELSSSSAESF